MKRFLFSLVLLTQLPLLAQVDTIGQVNARGKKQGYHLVYLDSNALKCDSAMAYFKAYEYYDDGKNTYDFYNKKWKKKDSVNFLGDFSGKGKPVLLSGKFSWYNPKTQMLTYEESYENGAPVKFKEIRYKRRKKVDTWAFIRTHDFRKRYHNVPGTYYIQEQNNQAIYNMEEWANFWFRDGKRGWKKYRVTQTKLI